METRVHRCRVMAADVQLILVDAPAGAAAWAEARLRQLEVRWSRFLDMSDISVINRSPERWVPVSGDTLELIRSMQLASRETAGAYDPTFLHQLLSAGYTTSIDDPSRITIAVDSPSVDHDVAEVLIDVERSSVYVPRGLSLDPGGIGKGLAADLVVTELLAAGTGGALASVGGDIAAAGVAPTPEGWHVEVEHPERPAEVVVTLGVSAGGVATSSTRSRRWMHRGVEQHHVIDPLTGERSATDLATVTVVANAGWLAEAHATAALLAGSDGVITYLDGRGLTGVAIDLAGNVTTTDDIRPDLKIGALS